MPTLQSPGVNVTVTDQSNYASSGTGTIPLILVATEQDKRDPTESETDGIAKYTKKINANKVVPVTSQRELTQFFGDPQFSTTEGDELNEFGLLSCYSYLGQGSQAYVVRADADLGELKPISEPTSLPVGNGITWFDTDAATNNWDIREWSTTNNTWSKVANSRIAFQVVDDATTAASHSSVSTAGNYLLQIQRLSSGINIKVYKAVAANTWTQLTNATTASGITFERGGGTTAGQTRIVLNNNNFFKTVAISRSNHEGAFSAVTDSYTLETSVTGSGNTIELKLGTTTSSESIGNASSYRFQDATPTLPVADGTLWFDGNTTNELDILIKTTNGWERPANITYATISPTSPSVGDIWIDTGAPDSEYPKISRWANAGWRLHDNTAQESRPDNSGATPPTYNTAVIFDDFYNTSSGLLTGAISAATAISSSKTTLTVNGHGLTDGTRIKLSGVTTVTAINDVTLVVEGATTNTFAVDVGSASGTPGVSSAQFEVLPYDDAPDHRDYDPNTLAVNMGQSGNTLKVYRSDSDNAKMIGGAGNRVSSWLNGVTNNANGSGAFGYRAQRKVIAQAMQASIAGNEDLRDPARNFTLLCAPNFPELTDELVTLNSDRGETGFIIIDAPMRKTPTEAVSWIQGGDDADENGEDGLRTNNNAYSAAYYPAGRSTAPNGQTVTVPPSHMALYTYAYNDNVAYPWFAPAGLTRGVVRNASAVGHLDSEGEFKAVTLSQGQRDLLYMNRLNPIASFPNEGVVIFGQRSLHNQASALDRVNVARLIAYLRERFDEIARPLLFEQNDPLTQARAVQLFSGFLSDMIAKRALDDFAVVCDASNNLPARVQRNELWVDIAVLPTKSIEFIYIPIRIVNAAA